MEHQSNITPRQRQVLLLVADGLANKEIAQLLGISVAAVKKHVALMLARYGAPNRTSLVRLAMTESAGEPVVTNNEH